MDDEAVGETNEALTADAATDADEDKDDDTTPLGLMGPSDATDCECEAAIEEVSEEDDEP
jgi:hypothetical protein